MKKTCSEASRIVPIRCRFEKGKRTSGSGRYFAIASTMNAPAQDIQIRTKDFALRIIRLSASIPNTSIGRILSRQVTRSGTSVGAHVREGRRSRSDAEMLSKIDVALQELEETRYWMELLAESGMLAPARLIDLQNEASQLTAILVTSAKTLKSRRPYKLASPKRTD